jgi:hypothetical protein
MLRNFDGSMVSSPKNRYISIDFSRLVRSTEEYMKALSTFLLSGVFILLTGCASPNRTNHTQNVLDQINADCEQKLASQYFDPIWNKVSLDGNNVTLDQLNIKELATSEEKPIILKLEQVLSICNGSKVQLARETGVNGIASALLVSNAKRRAALAELYGGTITYGEYNRRMTAINADNETSMAGVQQIQQSIDAQNTANVIQTYQALRPKRTTCNTTLVGSSAQTHCQ